MATQVEHVDQLFERFCAHLLDFPHLGDFLRTEPGCLARLKASMLELSGEIETHIDGAFVPRQRAAELVGIVNATAQALKKERDAAHSRDDLIHMLVHDLRNPVQGIALQANIALRVAGKSLDMEREQLLRILRTCQDLSRLLQNMLEIAGLESGEMPVACQLLDLAALVEEVVSRHLPVTEQAGIGLTSVLAAERPAVHADPALLRRVLANLITNAIRHSGSPDISVETTGEPNGAAARVIDHGRGIPSREQEKIFEKFECGSPSRSWKERSIGLGLYFSRLATERMGGRLALTSRPGLTIFEIHLPVA